MRADLLAGERRARHLRRALVGVCGLIALSGVLVRNFHRAPEAAPAPLPASKPAAAAVPDRTKVEAATVVTASQPASNLKTRPLAAWLADVARDADRDLVISPDLRGDLTASESKDLDWKARLEAYSHVFGFDFVVRDGLIEVRRASAGSHAESAREEESAHATESGKAPTENAAPAAGAAAATPAAAPPPPPPQTRVMRLAYATAKEAASVLSKNATGLDVTAMADPSSNSIVLSGQPKELARVAAVVGELDRPRRRILLEAKIVEVLRSARLDFGVEWKLTGTTVGGDVRFPPPQSDAGSAALVIATHGAAALDAKISALEAGGKLHVISRPSVVMVEGSPATIESVRILRIRLPSNGTVVGDEVSTGSNGRATEDIPVGVRLEVTPAIRAGGRVLLRVKAKSSSLGAPLPPDNIPEELSRMVDAEVLVTSGETAVLGGLSREAGSKSGAGVPGLRRVPGLGALFGRKSDASEDEELLVLVTPRVLD
ncbi:MAG TPA: secretin N-terminal domain-containing protein [Candidatus Limnocylindrales bacterium]|nr:secretin N-terminal domain-containing protein [Candidatus Limnocylindrales bacterium]